MTDDGARVSIVIPARNEGEHIRLVLDRLFEQVTLPSEVLVVVDSDEDTTVPVVTEYALKNCRVTHLVNTYGPGPANAIRYGIDASAAPVVVVTMADGSDDARQIDDLVRLVERGVVVAAASRYMAGGQQVGGPYMKGLLSKTAGRSLRAFAHIGTRDATNSFKAYSAEFVRQVGIDSRDGFEIGIELTAKAKRMLPASRRDPDYLAGPAGLRIQLQDRSVDTEVSVLVPLLFRFPTDRRRNPCPSGQTCKHSEKSSEATVSTKKAQVSRSARFPGEQVAGELFQRTYNITGIENSSKHGDHKSG